MTNDWMTDAACVGKPTEWFFPETGNKGLDNALYDKGRAVCAECPVRAECLAVALERREQFGLWGGLTKEPRRLAARTAPVGVCEECGESFIAKRSTRRFCGHTCQVRARYRATTPVGGRLGAGRRTDLERRVS